jgi:hypothetical protein
MNLFSDWRLQISNLNRVRDAIFRVLQGRRIMALGYNSLWPRPWEFLRELLKGDQTAQEVQSRLGIQPHIMLQWQKNPKFIATWAEVDALLRRRARTDALMARIAAARREVFGAAVDQGAAGPAAPPDGVPGAAALGPSPVTDERERIRIEHGERAAQAYDQMKERRAVREAARVDRDDSGVGASLDEHAESGDSSGGAS